MMLVSLHDVEEGIKHALTSADQHALDLATVEHERTILPLRAKAATLDCSSEATRTGIRDTSPNLKKYEARLNSLKAQNRSTTAAIAVAERNHNTYISQLCAHSRQPPPVPAAQQPPASANLATSVPPAAQQPPASANLATYVAPAAQQTPATTNLSTFVVPAATQSLDTTVSAATRSSAITAPAGTFSARPNTPTPAPRKSSTSTTPWSVVVSRTQRQLPRQTFSAAHDDCYLELRISKLMFENKHIPFDLRLSIKQLASDVNTALTLLHGGRSLLRFALELATQDRSPLSERLVDAILHLRDLLERACGTPDGATWVRETLRDAAAPHRPDMTESSASDSSTTTGQRRQL